MSKQKDQQPSQPDQARRRILSGIASVPVVMTLSNGAQGATASALDCRLTPPPDAGTECVTAGSLDGTPPAAPVPDHLEHTGPGDALRALNEDIPIATPSAETENYCVAYIDETGLEVFRDGAGNVPAGHVPVAASCYTSFV